MNLRVILVGLPKELKATLEHPGYLCIPMPFGWLEIGTCNRTLGYDYRRYLSGDILNSGDLLPLTATDEEAVAAITNLVQQYALPAR